MRTTHAPKANACSATVTPFKRIVVEEYVEVRLAVPNGTIAFLPGEGDVRRIRACKIDKDKYIEERRSQWNEHHIAGLQVVPPTKHHLSEMLRLQLDGTITVFYKAAEWERIGRLCDLLGIKPAEWLLAGVGYAYHIRKAA